MYIRTQRATLLDSGEIQAGRLVPSLSRQTDLGFLGAVLDRTEQKTSPTVGGGTNLVATRDNHQS